MALEGYKSNNHVIYSCKYHVVWTPKYRRPVLVGATAKRCQALIRQVAEKYDAEIFALEILSDHVHLLGEVDPQFGIHRLVKNIAVSSHAGHARQGRTLGPPVGRMAVFSLRETVARRSG